MTALARRQQALVEALLGRGEAVGLAALPGIEGGVERGLSAYRLNAKAVAAKALASVFPRVEQGLGDEQFAAMAWAFWRHAPSERGDLGCWGAALADFLDAQPGMDRALSDGARLDWACHEAERAADAALDAASLDLLATTEPTRVQLVLMPGLRLLRIDAQAIDLDEASLVPLLVWRKGWRAAQRRLDEGEAVFIEALLRGADLEQALGLAPNFDFSNWLQTALTERWLQAARLID